MTKVDQLIEKFKEFKEELNKNVNMSYGKMPNATTGTSGGEGGMYRSEDVNKNVVAPMTMQMSEKVKKDIGMGAAGGQDMMAMSEKLSMCKNGQWKLDKVDPQENINIPHPKGKAKMANGVNKEECMSSKQKQEGTNQRVANPPQCDMQDPRGRIHMVKEEGTNEKSNPTQPHNKGKFKVMDEVEEKSSKKESVKGKPYSDKGEIAKDDHGKKVQGNEAKGFDENKAPGRGTLSV